MKVKYYICKHCGNIVEKVKDKGVPVICCGEPMLELKAGVTDAAVEKHVPVYSVDNNLVHVIVGEVKHPMLEEHFIEWVKHLRLIRGFTERNLYQDRNRQLILHYAKENW